MPLRPPAGFISANYDPLKNPDAPTGVSATGGDAQATVSFTAPTNVGGSAVTAYYAVSNPGQITSSGASSPVTVTGLTNGTSYTFTVWALNSYGPGPYSAASGSVTPAATRGLIFAGFTNDEYTNVIQYISIGTTGNATDFGDLLSTYNDNAAVASATRAVCALGVSAGITNTMEYVTIANTGNGTDFGDLSVARSALAGCSNSTRGLFAGGFPGSGQTNVIDYITIASVGNATDFGDLTIARAGAGACASTTRGVWGGGYVGNNSQNVIDYVTIASTGNATDFGDLTVVLANLGGCSNSTRGMFGGGQPNNFGTVENTINYITIASTGNATDFGDLTVARRYTGACSSSTRGVWAGGPTGSSGSTASNIIDYVTIATTGNATDFGDMTQKSNLGIAGCSNGHGGL